MQRKEPKYQEPVIEKTELTLKKEDHEITDEKFYEPLEQKEKIKTEINSIEDRIFNALKTGQRKIRRNLAKKLKINWNIYVQIEKGIILSKCKTNDCPEYLVKKFINNKKGVK